MSDKKTDVTERAKDVADGMAVGGLIAGLGGLIGGAGGASQDRKQRAILLDAIELSALSSYASVLPRGCAARARVIETCAKIAGRIVNRVAREPETLTEAVAQGAVKP